MLRGPGGERVVPLDGFFEGPFQTQIQPDEILVAIRRGPVPKGAAVRLREARPAGVRLLDRRDRRRHREERRVDQPRPDRRHRRPRAPIPGPRRRVGARGLRRLGRGDRRGRGPRHRRRRGRTRTSTPMPSTGPRWPSSTRVARSKLPSAGRPALRSAGASRADPARLAPGRRPRRGRPHARPAGRRPSAGRRAGGSRPSDLAALAADTAPIPADGGHGPRPRAGRPSRGRRRAAARRGRRRRQRHGPWTKREPGRPAREDRRRAVRPDPGAGAAQPDRPARGVHRLRRLDRPGRRPRREHQGRADRRRRGGGRRPASG